MFEYDDQYIEFDSICFLTRMLSSILSILLRLNRQDLFGLIQGE